MRKQTVRLGLNLILAAMVWLILATFYHGHVARLFLISPNGEVIFVLVGLFAGGICGVIGILVTVAGMLRGNGGPEARLSYTLIFLAAALIIYFFLFYTSMKVPAEPELRPGETITI